VSPTKWQGHTPPARDWMIEGLVLRKTGAIFSGSGGLGKSLLMQQLLVAVAIGQPWIGMPVPNCRAFGVFAEDPEDELFRRQDDIVRHYGVQHGDLDDLDFMSLDQLDDPALWRTSKTHPNGGPTPLWHQIVTRMTEFGAQLLVIDNAAKVFEANENYKEHVVPFTTAITKLARDINGAVILVQHPSKDGESDGSGLSGNRSWRNMLRSQFNLVYPKEQNDDEEPTNERLLKFGKNNYGKRGNALRVEWKDGVFIPCTLSDQKGGLSTVDEYELRGKIEIALRSGIKIGQRFSITPGAHNHVGTVLLRSREWHRYNFAEINNSCNSMVRENRMVLVTMGPPSKRVVLIRPRDARYPGEGTDE
jgi:RecA-family ATPase